MGCYMRDAFVKYEECQSAWLSELEFAEKAHVLKMLARELGQDTEAVIAALAERGLDAALGVLALAAGAGQVEAYLRHRAEWRAESGHNGT